ncbi:MAG: hypothetical protein E6344_00285 [Clostridium sp.]|uniref:hypothetical protein n=1 Tax=Clostridium culturomicium TaxID=1499683 RepID=UPI00058DC701|nr:hypothetical protein [Clostridium culturomicium]MDU4890943.1 hypothetical protein [Clostridium sp.]MDU7082095.1 hypothetical protein [Clostridium sp.]
MFYLDIILKSLGILSLIAFMIIFIWGFVVFNGIYSQMRYTNYLLEKISHILNIQERNRRYNDKLTSTEGSNSNSDANIDECDIAETFDDEK